MNGTRARTLTAVLALALAAGCGGRAPELTSRDIPPALTIAPANPSTTPTSSPTPTASPGVVTMAFAGDVHFTGRTEPRLSNATDALGPISQTLSRADIAMVNLESAITTGGTPEPKEFHFRAAPSALTALKGSGVDVATMGNNHAVDYGAAGLDDSLAAIASGVLPVVGIGKDSAQAYAPWYTTVRGQRVAILAASQVPDRTMQAWTAEPGSPGIASAKSSRLVAAVRDARKNADIVVVYVHWGEEGNSCPIAEQTTLVADLSEAGADAIVGTHAHLLLGAGWKGRTYVAYGFGNFLWWRDNAYSNDTGVLTLTFTGRSATSATLAPAVIDSEGVPMPVDGAEADRVIAKWNKARECTDLTATPTG